MIKDKWWGILLALVIAIVSHWLGDFFQVGSVITALVIGLIIGNLHLTRPNFDPGIRFTEKSILETSIVLLGFSLNFGYLKSVSVFLWLFIGLSVILVIIFSRWISKRMGLSSNMGFLLGAGSAICGTAAIAAISPLLQGDENETGLSIGVINLLGTLGLFFLPALMLVMEYNPQQAGFLLGGVLQSVGHVTGAAFSLGDETGKLALIYKMGRILWLIPLILVIYYSQRNKASSGPVIKFPAFILFFLLAVSLAQWKVIPDLWKENIVAAGNFLLVVAMAGIGYKIKLRPLFNLARPALIAGVSIFTLQIILFWLILNFQV